MHAYPACNCMSSMLAEVHVCVRVCVCVHRMGNYKEAVEALKMALSLAQAEAEMKASKACSKTPTVEPAPIKTFTSTAKTATAMSQTKPGTMVDKATQTISRDAQTDTESGSKVRMVDMATQTEPMQSESGAKAKQGAKAKKSKVRHDVPLHRHTDTHTHTQGGAVLCSNAVSCSSRLASSVPGLSCLCVSRHFALAYVLSVCAEAPRGRHAGSGA